MRKRVIIRVFGLVQGVNFRYYTKRKAEELGLAGWVENKDDGSMTIVAEGEQEDLKKLIDWAKKGPSLASIEDIEIKWEEPMAEEGFEVKYYAKS